MLPGTSAGRDTEVTSGATFALAIFDDPPFPLFFNDLRRGFSHCHHPMVPYRKQEEQESAARQAEVESAVRQYKD